MQTNFELSHESICILIGVVNFIATIAFAIFFKIIYLPIFERRNDIKKNITSDKFVIKFRMGILGFLAVFRPGGKMYNLYFKRYKDDPLFKRYQKIPREKLWLWKWGLFFSHAVFIGWLVFLIYAKFLGLL